MNDLATFGLTAEEYQEAYRALRRGEADLWNRVLDRIRPAFLAASPATQAVLLRVMAALKVTA